MPAGLETFDVFGRSTLLLNTRICRIIGQFATGFSDGAFAIPGNNGSCFFFTIGYGDTLLTNRPQMILNGNVLSWTFNTLDQIYPRISMLVSYGRY